MSGLSFPNFFSKNSRRLSGAKFAAATLAVICISPATSAESCKPALVVKDVHFTEMQPPTWARTWSAVVSVAEPHCAAEAIGTFDIVFVREKETAPDLEFRERFVWRVPSVHVHIDFAADEAVQSFRIDNVTPCTCRE
jgi:hypothetical protein